VRFSWDPAKAAANVSKHGVTFDEALTGFADPLTRIFDDEEHSIEEFREIAIGYSQRGRLLVVSFTERDDSTRIFSAREVTGRERHDYEKNCVS
jgi:uncharacterized DUF497 family protein